jgi:hypothetical protein
VTCQWAAPCGRLHSSCLPQMSTRYCSPSFSLTTPITTSSTSGRYCERVGGRSRRHTVERTHQHTQRADITARGRALSSGSRPPKTDSVVQTAAGPPWSLLHHRRGPPSRHLPRTHHVTAAAAGGRASSTPTYFHRRPRPQQLVRYIRAGHYRDRKRRWRRGGGTATATARLLLLGRPGLLSASRGCHDKKHVITVV